MTINEFMSSLSNEQVKCLFHNSSGMLDALEDEIPGRIRNCDNIREAILLASTLEGATLACNRLLACLDRLEAARDAAPVNCVQECYDALESAPLSDRIDAAVGTLADLLARASLPGSTGFRVSCEPGRVAEITSYWYDGSQYRSIYSGKEPSECGMAVAAWHASLSAPGKAVCV